MYNDPYQINEISDIESENEAALEKLQEDKEIYSIVKKHHMLLCRKIMKANAEQIKYMHQGNWKPWQTSQQYFHPDPEKNAAYYRQIKLQLDHEAKENRYGPTSADFIAAVRDLMNRNLVLDRTVNDPGEGIYKERFLSCDMSEIDLPWDCADSDW